MKHVVVPRILRIGEAPCYLGMSRQVFDRDVRPRLRVIDIGKKGRVWIVRNWTLSRTNGLATIGLIHQDLRLTRQRNCTKLQIAAGGQPRKES